MRAFLFIAVLLCISLTNASLRMTRMNKKLSAHHPRRSSHSPSLSRKLRHVSVVDLDSPSKYDNWLTPTFSELSSSVSHKRSRLHTRMDDPCAVTPPPCDTNARCTATGGGKFDCACNEGYQGSGLACTETDPCSIKSSPPLCTSPATCVHTGPGQYDCSCPPNTKPNGKGCDAMVDHSVQINEEAAQIAIDGLKNLEDDKESQLEGFGRDQRLQDIQDRIKDLIKTRRASLNDLQDQEIDRVERKVNTVEETTESIASSEEKQSALIADLKNELDENDAATEKEMREKAEQILDKAKDQVINAHRDNLHFDGNTRTDDADQAIPTAAERAARLQAQKDNEEYMANVNNDAKTSVRIVPRTRLYVVLHPETHVIPEYAPVEHTTVNAVPSVIHPGSYHLKTSSHVDMVPVGVKVQQQQQQEVVAVQQQQMADPRYITPETRPNL